MKKINLYALLGSSYGKSLYARNPITRIMNANPLTVDETTPVDQVSRLSANTEQLVANLDNMIKQTEDKLSRTYSE